MKQTAKSIAALLILRAYLGARKLGHPESLREIAARLVSVAPDYDIVIVDGITVGDVTFELAQYVATGDMDAVPELGN